MNVPNFVRNTLEKWMPYDSEGIFGLHNPAFGSPDEGVMKEVQGMFGGSASIDFNGNRVGDFHLKFLKDGELESVPCQRLVNNIILNHYGGRITAKISDPVGVFYKGRVYSVLSGVHQQRGVYVSKFMEGKRLFDLTQENQISRGDLSRIVREIARQCSGFAEFGVYPLDFAPRDIIVNPSGRPILVDNEHVLYINPLTMQNERRARKAQVVQFEEDWNDVSGFEELKKEFKERLEEGRRKR